MCPNLKVSANESYSASSFKYNIKIRPNHHKRVSITLKSDPLNLNWLQFHYNKVDVECQFTCALYTFVSIAATKINKH